MSPHDRPDLREHLAAERTLLAYTRTGLAMMGFGFVVARFGLFLREIRAATQPMDVTQPGVSLWLGTALIVLSVIVNVLSMLHYRGLIKTLNTTLPAQWPVSGLAMGTACVQVIIGIATAAYLVLVR